MKRKKKPSSLKHLLCTCKLASIVQKFKAALIREPSERFHNITNLLFKNVTYAGVGFTYDPSNDVFYAPQPYPSWSLNQSTWLWESPTPYPTDGKMYRWDEPTISWVEVSAITE